MSRGALNDWPPRPVETNDEEASTPVVVPEEPLIGHAHDDETVLRLLAGERL